MKLQIDSDTEIKGQDSMMNEILPVLKNEDLMRIKNPDGFIDHINQSELNVTEVNFMEEDNSCGTDKHIVQIKSPDINVKTNPGESGTIESEKFGILKLQIRPVEIR